MIWGYSRGNDRPERRLKSVHQTQLQNRSVDVNSKFREERTVIRVTAEGSNVLVNPLQSLLDIEDTKVLRTVLAQLSRVRVGEDALSGVEADEDNILTGEIRSLELDITARTGDHSTAVHVHEDLLELAKSCFGSGRAVPCAKACNVRNHNKCITACKDRPYPLRSSRSSTLNGCIIDLQTFMPSYGLQSHTAHKGMMKIVLTGKFLPAALAGAQTLRFKQSSS